MSTDDPENRANKTTWMITGLAIILVAIATYMNYGPSTHHVGSIAAPPAQVLASNT